MTGIGSVRHTWGGGVGAFRWPLLAAAVVGLLAFLGIYAYGMSQRDVYQSRVALTVRPVTPAGGVTGPDYTAVVTANMPAVVELAGSRSVIEGARRRVPGAPPVGEISENTVVDIVPASSVIRVSVTADTPDQSTKLVQALTQEMINQDLFAPVGKMVPLDRTPPTATQVQPVAKVSRGMAMLLGLALSIATFVALSLLSPVVHSRRQLARIVKDPTMPVLDLNRPGGVDRAAALLEMFGGAKAVAVGRRPDKRRQDVERRIPELDAGDALDVPVLLIVHRGYVEPNEIESALALAQRVGARVIGVALS